MSFMKSIRKQLSSVFKYYMVMPQAYKQQIAQKNLRRTFYGLLFTMIADIITSAVFLFLNFNKLEQIKFHLIFLVLYLIVAIIGLIIYFLVKPETVTNIHIQELPFYFTASLGLLDCLYSFLIQGEVVFTAVIVFITMDLIITICFIIHPLYYIVFSTFVLYKLIPKIFAAFGMEGIICGTILFIILLSLVIYKWGNTKRLLTKEENLNYYRQALQSEVERQTEELNAQHAKIIKIQNSTIISLSNLVENRDSDTGEHVRRTSAYVKALAQKAQADGFYTDELTDTYIQYLVKAAPMHDIGKIVVPDAILKKPGQLTPEEFEMMKKHASEGGRIVKEILSDAEEEEYVKMAQDIATYHHEKWDGTGYPAGLKVEEIPLSARIMAVADVFDALVSPRCYKQPFPVEKAFEIIEEGAGKHFDPILTAEFLLMKDDIVQIMKKYED